ncbi:MAG: GIY-YIG nuclease family protein [Candidatus Kerfeldbacteria bacterium]|nr:GIY-YIG nuclease family protein [Candidatus Kerfeldbacteria bacterium]
MHYVYLLEDQKDRGWYIGYSTKPVPRLNQHRSGLVYSTRLKQALRIVYVEGYLNKYDALGRERFLKSGAGRRFLSKQLKHHLEDQNKTPLT